MGRPEAQTEPDSASDDLAAMLVDSTRATARSLSKAAADPSGESLRQALFDEVALAIASAPGLHVRGDRSPAEIGAWRFSALIESADRVVAAIDVTSAPDDLEHEAMALAGLSMGLGRGVAERGFLVAASRRGQGLIGSGALAAASHPASPRLPFVAEFDLVSGPWQLVLIEARRPEV